jgi:8-oxo-dGTP pyrophosphatase MutT (NUDIX family)
LKNSQLQLKMQLLQLLETHQPFNQTEAEMVAQTIAFVQSHENCFERTLLIGHVTGSAWIVDKDRSHALLIHHKKLNQWFQPGGHCDGESDVLQVALKEAQEETGLQNLKVVSTEIFDVDIHPIPERKGIPAHLHYDIRFLLEADKNEPLQLSEESNNLAWITLAGMSQYNDSESVMRMVEKILH